MTGLINIRLGKSDNRMVGESGPYEIIGRSRLVTEGKTGIKDDRKNVNDLVRFN